MARQRTRSCKERAIGVAVGGEVVLGLGFWELLLVCVVVVAVMIALGVGLLGGLEVEGWRLWRFLEIAVMARE